MKRLLLLLVFFSVDKNAIAQTRGLGITDTSGAAQKGETYAFIVGVSGYPNVTPLKYADRDAELFEKYLLSKLNGNVKPGNIKKLLNENAKGGLLTSTLSSLEEISFKPGDKLYIFMAGHGDAIDQDDYYFLGYDIFTGAGTSNKNHYRMGFALRMFDVKNTIKRIAKRGVHVYFILDACRTNEIPGGAAGQQFFASGVIEHPVGEIMMLAAAPGQAAIEDVNIGGGHGLFTWYLVDGLIGGADNDKDNVVTLAELNSYVAGKVGYDAKKKYNDHIQNPYFGPSAFYAANVANVDSVFFTKWVQNKNPGNVLDILQSVAYSDKRGGDSTIADTTITKLYNSFAAAIKKNQLIGKNSAEHYYNQLLKKASHSSLTKEARYTLAAEFMNYATGKINLFLAGKDQTSQSQYQSVSNAAAEDAGLLSDSKYKLVATIPYKITARYLAKAKELLKTDAATIRKIQPQYLFFLAKSYFESNHPVSFQDAVNYVHEALKLQPGAAYLHEYLGELYIEAKKYKEAESEINISIKLAPSWSYNYCTMGRLFYSQKKYPEAESWYKKAIGFDSAFSFAYSNLGNLYLDINKPTDAENNYKKSLQFDSTENIANSIRLYNIAVFYERQGNITVAETYYRKAVTADSTCALAANNLGVMRYNDNDFENARRYFEQALRHDSMLFNAYNNLGLVYDTVQNFSGEEMCYRKAIKLNSRDGAAYINLSNLYSKMQDNLKAVNCLKKAVQNNATLLESIHYNLACIYAAQGDLGNSVKSLELALKNGFASKKDLIDDLEKGELVPISRMPQVTRLLQKYFPDERK
jgi:tetratricopeptide (TPR) repeat protein